ncbi:M48 family metallopeptidase [Leptolyngbya sp. BC1307]|uniref:M48 family metallopeptidase n=1 Tax=Leptolyngbya sp. BC1307 TaxID=2029589 RepID=UPI000EFA4103|nr:M48 family metallopeptidase [Leptolyngbya sp. BC1307]
MSKLLDFKSRLYRRLVYGLVAMTMVLGIGVTTAQPSHAGWLDLIFQGVRVYQLSNMSNEQEVDLGRGINNQLVNSRQIRLYRNESLNTYVNDIGQRLAAVSDRPGIPYTFQIVQDSSVNAFATMGGYVYVTTGLMAAADNEAELASVIGHEIGHISGRHAVEQMRQAAITQGITGALGVNRDRLINIGAQVALQLPASRSAEYEADRQGFDTLGRAGYDQAAMVAFMKKLVRQGSPPEFLSTHPDARNRVTQLQQNLNESALPQATAGMSETAYSSNIAPLR